MEAKDDAAAGGDDGVHDASLCYQIITELLFPFVSWVVMFYVLAAILAVGSTVGYLLINEENRIESSAQLVGAKGLEPALAAGAVSPAFDLLVRVDNRHVYDQYRDGGGVTVSYAGIPLAHGRIPGFRVGAKAALTLAVNATTEAVGLPEDLFRLMSAERRWGVAQLDVRMRLGWESYYAWSIHLD